jgi:hypothetical protein
MKPASREDTFQKLRLMTCFKEVYERVLAGWPLTEIARFVQEDRSEYMHVSRTALVQMLTRFRDSLPPGELVSRRIPETFEKVAEHVEETLDELKELEKLYKLQMERISVDFETEKKIHKLMPTMTQEVRVARELLGAIADLKMDLGINARQLGQVNVDAKIEAEITARYGKDSIGKVLSDAESRRKVLNIAERLLALPGRTEKAEQLEKAEGDYIDVEAEEDHAVPLEAQALSPEEDSEDAPEDTA